jgi:hypothetical protein
VTRKGTPGRLCDLVRGKLAAEPAVKHLEREAAQGMESERTKLRLRPTVEGAAEKDSAFAGGICKPSSTRFAPFPLRIRGAEVL